MNRRVALITGGGSGIGAAAAAREIAPPRSMPTLGQVAELLAKHSFATRAYAD